MDIVLIGSVVLTILAIVNAILMVIFFSTGQLPPWILIFQGLWGILVATLMTVIVRRLRR